MFIITFMIKCDFSQNVYPQIGDEDYVTTSSTRLDG